MNRIVHSGPFILEKNSKQGKYPKWLSQLQYTVDSKCYDGGDENTCTTSLSEWGRV